MTIPALINNYQEKVTVAKVKKFYSIINQAYLPVQLDNGFGSSWCNGISSHAQCSEIFMDNFLKYLKTSKVCHNDKGCFPPNVNYKKLDGGTTQILDNNESISKMILVDGMSVFFFGYLPADIADREKRLGGKTYAAISVDINGYQKPNIDG